MEHSTDDELIMVRRNNTDPNIQANNIMAWCQLVGIEISFIQLHTLYLEFAIKDPSHRTTFLIKWK